MGSGKAFLGFGFGPIMSGLLLCEAQASGNFCRYTIAEVDQNLVAAIRGNRNAAVINIADADGIRQLPLTDLELLNPQCDADRPALGAAIATADELATAVPSVEFYDRGGDGSIAALLAAHLSGARPQICYAAENNNYAAEHLTAAVAAHAAEAPQQFQVLNTVIGKMSGVITDAGTIAELKLATLTPALPRAVLVESFNAIQVSRVRLPGVRLGIDVFEEKTDLLPFEEAKLYGHNATHALLGYLAASRGYQVMSELRHDRELMAVGRAAFLTESGRALIARYGAGGEPLFSVAGFERYVDDLLVRMTNPHLHDAVARICRDPQRKLGYDDRLFGAMRLALAYGVEPINLARGAAAALRYRAGRELSAAEVRSLLPEIWGDSAGDGRAEHLIELTVAAAG